MDEKDTGIALLREGIARNCSVVLSLPSAANLRHCKSRLLDESDNSFWAESDADNHFLIDELIETGKSAGISFRDGEQKVMLTAQLLKRDPAYQMNAHTQVDAVLLKMPERVVTVQRRSAYRVRVIEDEDVVMRMWRIAPRVDLMDRPMASAELQCKLINLSPGGAGVLLTGAQGQPPVITSQDRLRLELKFRDQVVVIEGAMRYPDPPPRENSFRAGIQFISQVDNMRSRQAGVVLTRLVGELQRRELRQIRMGMART